MSIHITRMLTPRLLSLYFRLFIGGMFLFAGGMKVLDPHGFAQAVSNYRLLPEATVSLCAVVLPWIEIIVGLSLLVGIWVPGAALVASSLLILFAGALAISLVRGLDISCGCFSTDPSQGTITRLYLLRDLILIAMSVVIFVWDQGVASLESILYGKNDA